MRLAELTSRSTNLKELYIFLERYFQSIPLYNSLFNIQVSLVGHLIDAVV